MRHGVWQSPAARLRSVLLVTNEFPPDRTAGTAMATKFLAEELAGRGYQITVVVNERRLAPAQEKGPNLKIIRLRPLPLPMTRMAQRAALLAGAARRLRPDIVQGQSLSCGFLAAVAARVTGARSVTYVQGYDLYSSGIWAKRTYIRWALWSSDRVVAVTPELSTLARALARRAVDVIPHGLRRRDAHALDKAAARSMLGLPRDRPIVLFVGRLVPNKGVAYLIQAFPRLRERSPEALLVIVGEGEQGDSLRRLAGSLAVQSHVQFVGSRPHNEVIAFMRAADLFVLPSIQEPFGIVLVEAMSCGLPIVASHVMGIPTIVETGVNGFLVPPGDPPSLAGRIAEVLASPDMQSGMRRRNVEKASSYDISVVADRFVEVWSATLARTAQDPRPG